MAEHNRVSNDERVDCQARTGRLGDQQCPRLSADIVVERRVASPGADVAGEIVRDARQINAPAAGAAPAGAVVEAELQSQPLAFPGRMAEEIVPFGGVEGHGAVRDRTRGVEELDAAEARAGERLEVGGDAVAGNVAVKPEPVHPRPAI